MTRILVEKKEPYRLDERDMLCEIRDVLGVSGISGVRIINGYDVEGSVDSDFVKQATHAVFSEMGQDIVYESAVDFTDAAHVFSTTAAIDQYDQREDYANQLLRILEPHSTQTVRTFKITALYGEISKDDYHKIKKYYINPTETREIPLDATKPRVYSVPEKVEVICGFIGAEDGELEALARKYEIAMGLDDLKLCREHFAKESRDPTVTEMKVLDTYWSDHCRHSTFMTKIESVSIDGDDSILGDKRTAGLLRAQQVYEQAKSYVYGDSSRPLCLMDIATMEMKKLKKSGALSDMEKSNEVNACSIERAVPVDGELVDMIVMFKNETHNHPTEIEPFGGASTCLGGGIRDPLSGRAHTFGAIRVTGSGDPREPIEKTLPGKLPQRKITQTAADGYSSYGNGIGLASGHLVEYYDQGFRAKRMECGALVAAARKADILRGTPAPGDVVVLVGGKTGRDGCGGATGSSKEHGDDSLEKGGAEVQKGNPVIERNIVRLFRKPDVSRMIKTCNDFGAGGVCVAVGELADGLQIDLDKVPVKYPGLGGTELAISESQERMAVVIEAGNLDKFLSEAAKENLGAVKIADVTDTMRVVMTWRGDEIVNLKREFLNSGGVRQSTNIVVTAPDLSFTEAGFANDEPTGIGRMWLVNLADLNICSKKGIADRFDTTVGGNTVFMPFGGVFQKTPEQGLAMRLPLLEGKTDYGTLMTVGYNPAFGYKSPFHAALYAVVESVMKIAAMGGDYRKVRLSFQEYFERLSSKESWGKPYAALMGAFLAQDELGIPAIGGKDSMSGTFNEINVPPSLLSFAVAVEDTTKLVSRAFKGVGNNVYLLKTPIDEAGVPNFKVLKRNMSAVHSLVQYGCIKSASIVGMGGIAAAVSEMSFGNGIGFSFDDAFAKEYGESLFAPQYASMIIELGTMPRDHEGLRDEFVLMGITSGKKSIEVGGVTISLDEAQKAWEGALSEVFPTAPDCGAISAGMSFTETCKAVSSAPLASQSAYRPKVLIPIFPGTTGEYALEKQFLSVGADVTSVLFRTMSASDIENSCSELAEAIDKADILTIPSGMSAGGEPDGGAKLIAIILRHDMVKNAIHKLLERKGLILGIGDGFKALVKTGLIQSGEVRNEECGDVIVANNPTNKYRCLLKDVKIENVQSPWFKGMSGLTETVPVSGKEIAVHMSEELYKEHLEKGQIAARYADACACAAGGTGDANSCGHYPIEAMISENGLVLGRAALVENLGKGLYINVFNASESKMFANAVEHIRSSVS